MVLARDDGQVRVSVRDDGKGIPDQIATFRPVGMRQRLDELGGDLRLQNANPGTLVEVAVPMTPVAAVC